MKLTLAQVSNMCNGSLVILNKSKSIYNINVDNLIVEKVVLDSREVGLYNNAGLSAQNIVNTLFVAIIGDNHDGHNFIKQSIVNGAVACIVSYIPQDIKSEYINHSGIFILVDDTTKALGLLAQNYRKLFNIPVVAITGSNGKTTVKEMLKSICEFEFGTEKVLATRGNLNNHWGMPLTMLCLEERHKVAILEMGMNHSGELNYLSNLAKPTIAVVNNALRAHTEFFANVEEVAKAKGEIYSGLLNYGIACINMGDNLHGVWEELTCDKRVFLYGVKGSQCYIKNVSNDGELTVVLFDSISENKPNEFKLKLQVLGQHNQKNAITAISLATNIGCSVKNIILGLENFKAYNRRLERKTAFNNAIIIDDTYNANPDSVRAAILAIQELPKPYWLILGDLGELGDSSEIWHREIGEFANLNNISVLLTVGEMTQYTGNSFMKNIKPNIQHLYFSDNQEVVNYCRKYLPCQSTLLIKGSRSMHLDIIVDGLVLDISKI